MPYKDPVKANEHARLRYALRRDEIKAKRAVWRDNNRERIKGYSDKYFAKHRESILARGRECAKRHRTTKSAYQKRWLLKNPHKTKEYNDKRVEYRKRYQAAHAEQYRAHARKYKRNHPEKLAEWTSRRRAAIRDLKVDQTADAFYTFVRSKEKLPCYYCGEIWRTEKMHVDHVIAIDKKGNHASSNLAASCPKCNMRKNKKLPSEIRFLDQPLLNL